MNKIIFFLLYMLVLAGCSHTANKSNPVLDKAHQNTGYIIYYDETGRDGRTFSSRVLVTQDYVRIDEGVNSTDYLLFDVTKEIIYNVVTEDETIMVIKAPDTALMIDKPLWTEKVQASRAVVPAMNTIAPVAIHYEFFLHGRSCLNVIAVDQQLEEVRIRMNALNHTLAQSLALHSITETDFVDQCHQAVNILDPGIRFRNGFPIREWSASGEQRFVQNIKRGIVLPDRLFELPAGFKRY